MFRSLEVGECCQFPVFPVPIPNWQHWHLVIGNTFTLATLFPPFRFYTANKGNYSIKKTTFHVSGLYLDFVLLVASRPTIVDDFTTRARSGRKKQGLAPSGRQRRSGPLGEARFRPLRAKIAPHRRLCSKQNFFHWLFFTHIIVRRTPKSGGVRRCRALEGQGSLALSRLGGLEARLIEEAEEPKRNLSAKSELNVIRHDI